MPFALCLLILILMDSSAGAPPDKKTPDVRDEDINVFLMMAWQVARHIQQNSSCYVCGLMPYTAGEGLPLMALPASDCDTCHLLHIHTSQSYSHPDCPEIAKMRPLNCSGGHGNCDRCLQTPKPVPIMLIPQPFPWCLENDGKTPVGRSDCVHTYKWDPKQTQRDFESLNAAPHQCLDAAGSARLNALAHRTAMCSISSPVGMYWVCGSLAYPYLPVDYSGRCGLAYVVPAMRVARSLPKKPHHRKRRGASDIFGTHHQSGLKNVLGPLLPFYGVMSALDQISDLSHAIETIANETGRALQLMSSELASVRLLALQNRAALDFLLSAQGGTCSVIGSECCTFVPEYNATINDIVNHLHVTATSVHQESSSLFDWLKPTFGSLTHRFVEGMIILVIALVLLSCFVSCLKKFLFNIK
ncbi:endogenous retroviral envelope protein HEMO-like [Sphaeramia orbicularis]|uniref:Endogenous retroviral envelope protein HEMO-like n=1 Tax=Sphaeramia orbicularis TaxID=375764 RepID=A0A672Z419_9TELE|nr:endogenous retroviral envelope protein HEMO-like [Sphaeramia orbicularis]